MAGGVELKWLGVSGVELACGGHTVLIDPLFSRVPLRRVLFRPLRPDGEAVRRHTPPCEYVFITHAHYDHLLDAPQVLALTGAELFGPPNACAIAGACGAAGERLHALRPGDRVQAGPFAVTALRSSHLRLPGFGYGRLRRTAPPLRARQYRMDLSYVYLVEAEGARLLIGPGLCLDDPGPVDALLCCPMYLGRHLSGYVGRLHPNVFLPIHWEDMFRKASRPPRPGLSPGVPPHRVRMGRVAGKVRALGVRYLVPERGRSYGLPELME